MIGLGSFAPVNTLLQGNLQLHGQQIPESPLTDHWYLSPILLDQPGYYRPQANSGLVEATATPGSRVGKLGTLYQSEWERLQRQAVQLLSPTAP